MSSSEGVQSSNQEPDESLREYYARQLMQPEWLTDMPEDLRSEWSVATCILLWTRLCLQTSAALYHLLVVAPVHIQLNCGNELFSNANQVECSYSVCCQ